MAKTIGVLALLGLVAAAPPLRADDFVSVQLMTGNDDFRAGSRADLLLELGDNSLVVVPSVAGGTRLPDNTLTPFSQHPIGQVVDRTDVRRIGIRFVADRGGGLNDDQWVLRSMSVRMGSSATQTAFADAVLDHKFENDGTAFSGVLPSFDPSKLRDMVSLAVGIDTDDDNLEGGSTVNLAFGIDGEAPRTFVLVPSSVKLVDHNRNYFMVPLSPPVPRDKARSISLTFLPSGNDEWHFNRVEVDATDVAGFDQVFDPSHGIAGTVKLKKANSTFAPAPFPPFPVKPAGPDVFLLVLDESRNPVPGAEVFVDTIAAGTTDAGGMLDLGVITLPRNIYVRKLILEHPTYRNTHMANSIQNWNYRVYLTNAWVGFDGKVTPAKPSDPSQLIVTTVRKDRVLFGLNILASLEWDGDMADLILERDKIIAASRFLFNATDGQYFIDRCTVMDDRQAYDDSDYRVHADANLRAEVNNVTGGFLGNNALGSSMQMSRSDTPPTHAHEFGHYGFDLSDEYEDNNPGKACSSNLFVVTNPFTVLDPALPDPTSPGGFKLKAPPGNPIASCMMWLQSRAPKICSGREENPHADGTWEGSTPCWEKLRSRYVDAADRWRILTPLDRDSILGSITFPPVLGAPPGAHPIVATQCSVVNKDEDRFVGHVTVFALDAVGAPVAGLPVYLQTTNDLLYEGMTNNVGGLDVAGCHGGDTVFVGNAVLGPPTGQGTITGPGPLVVFVT